jgi:predicted nucleic acid-binding protein
MNGKAFFDTNVLIYAALRNDARSGRAEEILAAGGVISVQVLNEFVSVARRKHQMPWGALRNALRWIGILCPGPAPLTVDTHEAAIRIAEKYKYRIYDSLIVASAIESKCGTLYSEDLQNGQVIDGIVTIRNPFR